MTSAPPPQKRPLFLILLGALVIAVVGIVVVILQSPDKQSSSPSGVEQTRPVAASGKTLVPMPDSGTDPAVGTQAPTVEGQTFDGKAVKIGGDATPKVIVFLAHWCPHCQREVPVITQWIASKGVPAGVSLYAVATATDPGRPNYPPSTWLDKANWPITTLADDKQYSASSAYGLTGFPFFVAVNAKGTVVARTSGEKTVAELEALVAAAAKG